MPADRSQNIDGVLPPPPPESTAAETPAAPSAPAASPEVRRLKQAVAILGGLGILAYILWAIVLMVILPDPAGGLQALTTIGLVTLLLGIVLFLGAALVGFLRIKDSKAPIRSRKLALIKIAGVLIPTALFGMVAAFLIVQEPSLSIDIISPTKAEEFVAPLPVTFSVERAVAALEAHGFRPIQYAWDLRGNGKNIEKTVTPRLTTSFDKEGVYPIAVQIIGADGSTRTATRRLVIQRSVFAISPNPPIIHRPVALSLSNLLTDPKTLAEAAWDTDGDGAVDETSKSPQITTTYHQLGPVTVSVLVQLANKTQARYERTFEVVEPPELPFPVTLDSVPKKLIGAPPFGVLFTITTEEPVAAIQWNFGDGSRGDGDRVAHTFTRKGSYAVTARVRSQSGSTAELISVVSVVDPLQLPDLAFDGTPKVSSAKITGELPLKINVTPRTKEPFVAFSWEVPDDVEVASTEGTLNAIYREAGTYTVTLVAEDAEHHVLRLPITIEVKPPSSLLSFSLEPESGSAPLTVRLDATDTVIPEKTITGFEWDFGDRSDPVFGAARTEHVYEKSGTYAIQLTVRTTEGDEFVTTKTIVVTPPVLRACILPSRTSGRAPLGIKFETGCSIGSPESILWDFGDGTQTDEENPIHVFDEPGDYIVTLTFVDDEGNTQSATVGITATER